MCTDLVMWLSGLQSVDYRNGGCVPVIALLHTSPRPARANCGMEEIVRLILSPFGPGSARTPLRCCSLVDCDLVQVVYKYCMIANQLNVSEKGTNRCLLPACLIDHSFWIPCSQTGNEKTSTRSIFILVIVVVVVAAPSKIETPTPALNQ